MKPQTRVEWFLQVSHLLCTPGGRPGSVTLCETILLLMESELLGDLLRSLDSCERMDAGQMRLGRLHLILSNCYTQEPLNSEDPRVSDRPQVFLLLGWA